MSSKENQQEKNKKVRVNIKARLIDKRTQKEHKDYDVVLDTSKLVINNLHDLEDLPLKFKINPKVTGNERFSLNSMSESKNTKNESQDHIPDNQDSEPKLRKNVGHVSIQEYPNSTDHLMDDQSVAPSSIFQSNILDHHGFVRIQNQTDFAPSQYYDPNEVNQTGRSKRFVFKIPAIQAGDKTKKVIRTKITFNLKNLLQNSTFGPDDLNHRFVNFSESDVEPVKKVSKHVMIVRSDEASLADKVDFGSYSNDDVRSDVIDQMCPGVDSCHSIKKEPVEDHQRRSFEAGRRSTRLSRLSERRHMAMDFLMDEFGVSKNDLLSQVLVNSEASSEASTPSINVSLLKDISFPESKSLLNLKGEQTSLNDIEKQETETLNSKEVELVLALLKNSKTDVDEMKSTVADSSDLLTEQEVSQTSSCSVKDQTLPDIKELPREPTDASKSNDPLFPTQYRFKSRDATTFPVDPRSFLGLTDSSSEILINNVQESIEKIEESDFSKLEMLTSEMIELENVQTNIDESLKSLTEINIKQESSQMISDKMSTVRSSLLRLGEALEHSLKVIADTKFKAVSMESTVASSDERDFEQNVHKKRLSVSFTNVPQSTPIHVSKDQALNLPVLSHVIGGTDALLIESVLKVAEVWKNLKEKIIAHRHSGVKSYSDILTENELLTTFSELVKQIIGIPSEMRSASIMKETFLEMSSQSLRQEIASTETLNGSRFNSSAEQERFDNDPDLCSLRRLSKELQQAMQQENHPRNSVCRSSNKSTMNLLHPSEDSFIKSSGSSFTRNASSNMRQTEHKYELSLSDSQLRILADIITENFQSRHSMGSAQSNASTRSFMEKSIKDLKQGLQDMKDQIQFIARSSLTSYEEEVKNAHENLFEGLIPEQVIAEDIEHARQLINELEQRLSGRRQSEEGSNWSSTTLNESKNEK